MFSRSSSGSETLLGYIRVLLKSPDLTPFLRRSSIRSERASSVFGMSFWMAAAQRSLEKRHLRMTKLSNFKYIIRDNPWKITKGDLTCKFVWRHLWTNPKSHWIKHFKMSKISTLKYVIDLITKGLSMTSFMDDPRLITLYFWWNCRR